MAGSAHNFADQQEAGLTLLEIMISLILLAGALIILLGLQTSVLARTGEDQQRLTAMLLARQILAVVESSEEPLENETMEGSIATVLDKLGAPDPDDEQRLRKMSAYQAHLRIQDLPIPNIEGAIMKHLVLSISWGARPDDVFKVDYFFPSKIAEDGGGGGEDFD